MSEQENTGQPGGGTQEKQFNRGAAKEEMAAQLKAKWSGSPADTQGSSQPPQGAATAQAEVDPLAAAAAAAQAGAGGAEEVPWNKDPRFQKFIQEKNAIDSLLQANKVASIEDLRDLAATGAKLKGTKVDLANLDTIIEKASKLDDYEKKWNVERERRRRATETPQQTIQRLEAELKHRETKQRVQKEEQDLVEEAKQSIARYEKSCSTVIAETLKDQPQEVRDFALEYLGVNNPFNDVDLNDPVAIQAMAKQQTKKLEAFAQKVIEQYTKGKIAIPNVPRVESAPVTEAPKIKNMKDARNALKEGVKSIFRP